MTERASDAIERDVAQMRRLYLHYRIVDQPTARAIENVIRKMEERVAVLREAGS